jgi:DNA-binding NtrC family response regulator
MASRYLVARAWVRPDAKGVALEIGAVVDIGTTGRLVGRIAQLGVLDAAIERAAAGSAQVVAISGEAGIGKSRLAREGLRAAGNKGFRTLRGRCRTAAA